MDCAHPRQKLKRRDVATYSTCCAHARNMRAFPFQLIQFTTHRDDASNKPCQSHREEHCPSSECHCFSITVTPSEPKWALWASWASKCLPLH